MALVQLNRVSTVAINSGHFSYKRAESRVVSGSVFIQDNGLAGFAAAWESALMEKIVRNIHSGRQLYSLMCIEWL